MSKPKEVTKTNPCPHCGKPDWCYSIGDLTVCNRDFPPSDDWYQTSKTDKDGHYYYAPNTEKPVKKIRPQQMRIWEYPDRNGNPLVRVIRVDNGNGGKPRRWQESWNGTEWVKGLKGIKREDIPIYRYREVQEAILQGKTIYIVEGEVCADALWALGIPATTNIGGSGKWRDSDTQDLFSKDKGQRTKDKGIELETNEEKANGKRQRAKGAKVENISDFDLSEESNPWFSDKEKETEIDNQIISNSQPINLVNLGDSFNHQTPNQLQELDTTPYSPLCPDSDSLLPTPLLNTKFILCPDRDIAGVKHTETIRAKIEEYVNTWQLKQDKFEVNIQWLYAFPNSPLWNQIPESNGLDVADWIADYQLTAEDITASVESQRNFNLSSVSTSTKVKVTSNVSKKSKVTGNSGFPTPDSLVPKNEYESTIDSNENELINIKTHYTQMCIDELYGDKPWKVINGQLHQWNGKYYQQVSHSGERKRIADWCNTTPVQVGNNWKYAYATATHIDNIWRWLMDYFSVKSNEEVNPPGINCLNGVVKLNWQKNQVSWQLVPHHPDVIYNYICEFNFDENADQTQCDRLLSCLESLQQELFLKTIACALDLKTVRKYRGREVRALLCQGHGNNGKDTLREAVRMIFGSSLTNATMSDFAGYDNGRKFSLAKLERAVINWSSENSSFTNLDQLQSLKAAITGEAIDIEKKGVDEKEIMLNAVFLFNINELPGLKAGMEAIQSRWAVLSFHKTYKKNADPNKGEIEADSRFRYDPQFLLQQVCPALLNKLLHSLQKVMSEGIDYSCTESAIKNIQEETNHLWGFAREIGLDYQEGGRIYINDLWELLYKWYVNNGTLEIITENGKQRKVWHEQVKRGDKNVKAPNQIYQRFSELFPKIKKERNTSRGSRAGQFYLSGISAEAVEIDAKTESLIQNNTEAENFIPTNVEAVEAIKAPLAQILIKTGKLKHEQKDFLVSMLLSDRDLANLIFNKLVNENYLI